MVCAFKTFGGGLVLRDKGCMWIVDVVQAVTAAWRLYRRRDALLNVYNVNNRMVYYYEGFNTFNSIPNKTYLGQI